MKELTIDNICLITEKVKQEIDKLDPTKFQLEKHSSSDKDFLIAYKNQIPKGWYGFDLGSIPGSWIKVIDLAVSELSEFKEFEIHQIKIKFGGVRFYTAIHPKDLEENEAEKILEELDKITHMIEGKLFSKHLIY